MALVKRGIAEKIQDSLGFSGNQSVEVTETRLGRITSSLQSGHDVRVSDFGTSSVKGKKERDGRNPATGGRAFLPARRAVVLKCSGKLRGKVNGG